MKYRHLSVLCLLSLMWAIPASAKASLLSRDTTFAIVELKDMGNISYKDASGTPLAKSFTTGLLSYIKQQYSSKGHGYVDFVKYDKNKKADYLLEGEMSHVVTNEQDAGPYLITLRFKNAEKRVFAQWSGYAQTLMSLTSNLRNDPRVSRFGLMGELGDRVTNTLDAALTGDPQKQRERFLKNIKQMSGKSLYNTRLLADNTPTKEGTLVLPSNTPFKIETGVKAHGDLYLVHVTPQGLALLPLSDQGKMTTVEPQVSLLLPSNGKWISSVVSKAQEESYYLLQNSTPKPQPKDDTLQQPRQGRGITAPTPPHAMGLAEQAHVVVLEGGNTLLPRQPSDIEVQHLLDDVIAGTKGADWSVAELTVRVTPIQSSLWDQYSPEKKNEKFVTIRIKPKQGSYSPRTKLQVELGTPSAEGYLFVLNKTSKGALTLFSPKKSASVDELLAGSRVSAGNTRTIQTVAQDQGKEELKAILFRTEADARQFAQQAILLTTSSEDTLKKVVGTRRIPKQEPPDTSAWDYFVALLAVQIATPNIER